MFGATVAWGLDIGSATIKAVKLRKTGSGVMAIDFDVVEIEYSEDEATRPARVKAALAELVKRKKFGRTPVFFSVPGNQVFFRPFNLPAVGDRKIAEIVRYEARQQVPFALEEVVWDYQTSPGNQPGELTVSLVAIRKEIVDRLLESLREYNLNVVGLAPSPIAALNYVHYDVGPEETSLVLDAGAKVTDFVILHEKSFWFRPLPVAGADITHVLEQKFRMPYAEAENLKLKMGESKQSEKMFQVVEPTLRSLAGEIQRTAGYYKSLSRDVRIGRVFGIGHTFALPGLVEFLSRNIEMEVEILSAPQRITVSPGIDTTWFAEEFAGMGAAIGLALQALGEARVEMSLLPEAIVAERRAATRRVLFGVAAAAILGVVVSEYFAAQAETGETRKLIERMRANLEKVDKEQEDVNKAAQNLPKRQEQLMRWAAVGSERGLYGEVLEKVLKAVSDHNGERRAEHLPEYLKRNPDSKFLDPGVAVEGEVYLSALHVSWENPLTCRLEAAAFPSEDRGLKALADKKLPLRTTMFVAARFESRSQRREFMVKFEKGLHAIAGFKSVREKEDETWLVGSREPTNLPIFDWENRLYNKRNPDKPPKSTGEINGLPFWAVWKYEPTPVPAAAGSGAGAAG